MSSKSTPFERAKIRLQAWEATRGWGNVNPDKTTEPWGWERRMEMAAQLAEWAWGAENTS